MAWQASLSPGVDWSGKAWQGITSPCGGMVYTPDISSGVG